MLTAIAQPAVDGLLETDSELEELWDRDLPCEHPDHSTDSTLHEQEAPASFRGYAPCGRVLNICGKFAEILMEQMDSWPRPVDCHCGDRHWLEDFSFRRI